MTMLTSPGRRAAGVSPEDDRPEVDEDHLDVERDEQQGVDVEREAEAAVGVAVGVDPRLVGQALVLVAAVAVRDSQAAPMVRKTNDTPAKAKPTMYQMPVNRTPFERRAGGLASLAGGPLSERAGAPTRGAPAPDRHSSSGSGPEADAPDGRPSGALTGCVGERRAPSARAGSRAAPRQVVPDRREACPSARTRRQ